MLAVYHRLHDHYGPQAWWPAENPFEVMVGAILTQNTAWTNVEKAIDNLKQQGQCNAQALVAMDVDTLAQLIRPSGYFNQKAKRLKGLAEWFQQAGGMRPLSQLGMDELRAILLSLHGIGDETADDIVLYAFERPSFVIDAYTRRLFSRLGIFDGNESYSVLRDRFQDNLGREVQLYQQYHALIVMHAKQHCKKKPDCFQCPLAQQCGYRDEA